MKNSYETSKVLELSRPQDFVQGMKPFAPFEFDAVLGMSNYLNDLLAR